MRLKDAESPTRVRNDPIIVGVDVFPDLFELILGNTSPKGLVPPEHQLFLAQTAVRVLIDLAEDLVQPFPVPLFREELA